MFKPKPKNYELISFNKEKLFSDLALISDKIRAYKQDECLILINELIRVSKNVSIIDASYARDEKDMLVKQSKILVYQELQNFIEAAITKIPPKEESKSTVRPLNAYRRTANQAGSSI